MEQALARRTVVFEGGVQVVQGILDGTLASDPSLDPEAQAGQHGRAAVAHLQRTCQVTSSGTHKVFAPALRCALDLLSADHCNKFGPWLDC